MTARPTVLVLDGHTIQALACVRSLGRAGYSVMVASHRRRPLAASSKFCLRRWRVPAQTVDGFAQLRAWAAGAGVDIVLPLTERSCLLCNAERAAWADRAITVGCGPNDMLLQAFDKARTLQRAEQCGIRIPTTRFPTTPEGFRLAAQEVGLPCVVKARYSNVWDGNTFRVDPGVAYVTQLDELDDAVAARCQGPYQPLIQRFVSGRGRGVFTVCDRGRPLSWFAHERLRDVRPSGSGSCLRRSVPLEPTLQRAAEQLLGELEWHGPAMLEFLDDGHHTPWLMEINGRFWGSLHLAVAAGADFPLYWVRLLSGLPVSPKGPYQCGVTARWLWGDVKRLLYIAKGAPVGYPRAYPRMREGLREFFGLQPPGTRIETWDPRDPWPLAAEVIQGITELFRLGAHARASQMSKAT